MIIFVVVLTMSMMFRNFAQNADVKEIKFSQFANHLEKGSYESVNITDRKLTGTTKNGEKEITYAPSLVEISWLEETVLNPMLEENKIELDSEPPKSDYTLLNLLPTILMVVAMGFLFYFMMSQGGNKQAFQFGKNRARLYKSDQKSITFKDVAGLEEEKVELAEIVDFLRNPGKYNKLGARIPKGVLLVGHPGTGKTYISRATAGVLSSLQICRRHEGDNSQRNACQETGIRRRAGSEGHAPQGTAGQSHEQEAFCVCRA
jgi:cell division protease FtsH